MLPQAITLSLNGSGRTAGQQAATKPVQLLSTILQCALADPCDTSRESADAMQPLGLIWNGKRHAMTMPVQLDRFGQCNISFIGDPDKPKVQLLGVRGIPGNTINHPCSYFVGNHSPRAFVERVDMVSGVGYDPERWPEGVRSDFAKLNIVVTNLAVLDFEGPDHAMRVRSLHPGVTLDQVREQTGFELSVAENLSETPIPTTEQLRLIREVLDPHDQRASVYRS